MEKLSKEVRSKLTKILEKVFQAEFHTDIEEAHGEILALFPPQKYLGEEELIELIKSVDLDACANNITNKNLYRKFIARALSNRLPAFQPILKDIPETFMGYRIEELKKIIQFAQSKGYVSQPVGVSRIKDILAQPLDRISSISLEEYGKIRQSILDIVAHFPAKQELSLNLKCKDCIHIKDFKVWCGSNCKDYGNFETKQKQTFTEDDFLPEQEQKYCVCKEPSLTPVIGAEEFIGCQKCGKPLPPLQEKVEVLPGLYGADFGEQYIPSYIRNNREKINELIKEINLLRKQKGRK